MRHLHFLVFGLISLIGTSLCQEQQFVRLFTEVGCQGSSSSPFLSTNIYPVPNDATYLSYQIFGLWIFNHCPLYPSCDTVGNPPTLGQEPVCEDYAFSTGSGIFVTRFGDANQAARAITFHSAANLNGTSRTITQPTEELNLSYVSYFHTGNHSWTLYEGPNYDGNSRCITADPSVNERGYGITYVPNEPGTIGSIQEGCGPLVTDPTAPTTMPTTTSPTSPTTNLPTTDVPSTGSSTVSTSNVPTTNVPSTGAPSTQQYVRIFLGAGCQGENIHVTNAGGLHTIPGANNYASFEVSGLWIVHPCQSAVQCDQPYLPPVLGNSPVCVEREFQSGTLVYVTRFGDSDQIAKQITFYPDTGLNGTRSVFIEDTAEIDISYGSYFHTGNHVWTLYDNSNYEGASRCILPETVVDERGYGITYRSDESGTLGSIREGCWPAVTDPTATTMPTTQNPTGSPTTNAPSTGAPSAQQYVRIFLGAGCQGENIHVTNAGGLHMIPGSTNYASFEANGLWLVQPCQSAVQCDQPHLPPVLANSPICVEREFQSGTLAYVSRFGDSDQIAKQITFYTDTELNGTRRAFSEDTAEIGISYGSFFHTGNHVWTLYDNSNYEGASRCILPETVIDERGYGITYRSDESGTLGSIREGCWPTVTDPTATTQPTSGSTTQNPTSGSTTQNPTGGSTTQNPTAGPTTQNPTSGPTTQNPTGGPTTQNPTGGPTTQNPTGGPTTQNPTGGPTTQSPTSGPTSAPTTLVPDTFDCANRTDGIYPHPASCATFAICEGGTSTSYQCPEPLLFHPIELRCMLSEWVICELQCSGRPDGVYPHPKDCASFLVCQQGYTQVFQCPGQLLFDPLELKCNLPHLVDCTATESTTQPTQMTTVQQTTIFQTTTTNLTTTTTVPTTTRTMPTSVTVPTSTETSTTASAPTIFNRTVFLVQIIMILSKMV